MQFRHGSFCFFDVLHLHKRKAFRAVGVSVVDDFDILHGTDSIKEFQQIAFGGIEG